MNKLTLMVIIVVFASCANQNKLTSQMPMANEPFIIYKTKADYKQLVPVIMNDDKTVIVSYPAPADLKMDEGLRLPTELPKGYLLDQKGIGKNVAFTSYTYSEYAAMNAAPTIDQLLKSIVDNDPLLELYDCKNQLKIKYDINEVKKLVKHEFNNCVRVK